MIMDIKKAIEIYFERLEEKKQSLKIDNVDVYFPDKPKTQHKVFDFEEIEKTLGFTIHQSIKDYYSAYNFEYIEGLLGKTYIQLDGTDIDTNIPHYIKWRFDYCAAEHFMKDHRYYLIGDTDHQSVMVNNDTGEVTAVVGYEQSSEHLADSLSELVGSICMEAREVQA